MAPPEMRLLGSTARIATVLPGGAQHPRQRVDQRAFSSAGGAGDADHAGVAGTQLAHNLEGFRIAIFHARGGSRQCARVALPDFPRPLVHQFFRSCRAITRR